MTSLSEYLAKNYLTADPSTERPKKKRKKTSKHADSAASTGLIITDDDPPDLRSMAARGEDEEEGENGPVVATGRSAEFRRAKKSGWKVVGDTGGGGGNEADADAILASAAAEKETRQDERDDEDAPAIAGEEEGGEGIRMESGAKAGLQTAEQTAAMVASQEKHKANEAARYKKSGEGALGQETIYRDASGRIINVAMKLAEARKAEQQAKEKEEAEREAQMGDVQRQERESRKTALSEARAMPVARTIEDEELNEELREKQRWDDPAAGFLTSTKGPGKSVTGRPLYKGSFQPNRYGIRPGHRWDGVDRATGFEKEWFASRNRKGRMEDLEYQWQMDE